MELEGIDCGDCDAKNPKWASINRGVLLCDECCSVHRQLGRYVSQVKNIRHSYIRPTQLAMFQYLVKANVNRFWEHVLFEELIQSKDKKSRRSEKKPKPNDPIIPKKRDFIIQKYSNLAFTQKQSQKIKISDLNQQLHASVRTGVLETSLQLLAQGANPNAIHPAKGTSAVHYACENNQIGQLELLIAYGGDICSRDLKNRSSFDIALKKCLNFVDTPDSDESIMSRTETAMDRLKSSWTPLLDSLVYSFYEIPDGYSQYLFKTSPNHKCAIIAPNSMKPDKNIELVNGHFYLPLHGILNNRHTEKNSHVRSLKNQRFQYLCTDVYDETERRLLNEMAEKSPPPGASSTASLLNLNGRRENQDLTIPFLPINTEFSQIRNQARQKLARLNEREFRELLIDTLLEVSVRLNPIFPPLTSESTSQGRSKNSSNVLAKVLIGTNQLDSLNRTDHSLQQQVLSNQSLDQNSSIRTINNNNSEAIDDKIYDDPVYDQVAADLENGMLKKTNSPHPMPKGLPDETLNRRQKGHQPNQTQQETTVTERGLAADEVTTEIVRLKQANLELKERLLQMQSAKFQYEAKFGNLESEINTLKRELSFLRREKNSVNADQSYDSGNSFRPSYVGENFEEVTSIESNLKAANSEISILGIDSRPKNPHFMDEQDHSVSQHEPIPAERKMSQKTLIEQNNGSMNDNESLSSDNISNMNPAKSYDRSLNSYSDDAKISSAHEISANLSTSKAPVYNQRADLSKTDNLSIYKSAGGHSSKPTFVRDELQRDKTLSSEKQQTRPLLPRDSMMNDQNEHSNVIFKNTKPTTNSTSAVESIPTMTLAPGNGLNPTVSRTSSPFSKPPIFAQSPVKQNFYNKSANIDQIPPLHSAPYEQTHKSILKQTKNTFQYSNSNNEHSNGINLPIRNVKNSTDAVVQAVETIIVRIRNLLDVANGRSIGNSVQLSKAIQTSVNEILILFPISMHTKGPYSYLAPSLALLRTSSISLCQYCQRQTQVAEDKFKPPIKVEVIIKHAHEIARSAKEILNQYQNKNP